jgi:hypothetical protein
MTSKKFLHVGCGFETRAGLKGFNTDAWQEVRFDINKDVKPDIEGTLTDMSRVGAGSMDALYSAHNIEHIYPHEVPQALREFHRVLTADGFVVITCPDLQSVCAAVANDKLMEPLYQSPAGPISAIDVLFGHRGFMAQGNLYMAHRGGFTYRTLEQSLFDAGFSKAIGGRRPALFDLWMVAFKGEVNDERMRQVAGTFLP